ncbi:serine hydrolase [Mesorhizobium sp. YR577]|uniref:serine hydrolase domain-containing protein n=1 Tax=Mesorhizobium sp. YR577 TaxID=1884373 RepID=UPI0008DFA1CF|nr:serine hydrolase [Mesorhizobium sp. YR577]SFU22730.1 CubicO group peptidase, beta-lactamase class C family [Mesorhizobium sp. YR577]
MNANSAPHPRDPLNRGAPILPRGEWDYPPHHRWTFQHIREMTATAQVWRGPGPVLPLPTQLEDIDGIEFEAGGRRRTVRDFLDESFTDGFLVLSRGTVIAERYMNGMKPHGQHLAMSVTKSIVATVAGILVDRGLIDLAAPVTKYLPELETTAYRGATVQQVLDMTAGVLFDESYKTPGSHMQKLDQACGWKPMTRPDWPQTMWQLILTLTELERPHGELFRYRSIETDVLGLVMERATGLSLAELISSELWVPMGAEEDAYMTVDHGGYALADGGFNATLRDYARFALLHLRGGKANGRQIVPSAWIEATRNGNHDLFQGVYREVLPRGAYHNQFWIEDTDRRAYMARGIFGQYIYIDPEADFAAVKLSTWPEFVSAERSIEALAAFHAIREHCKAD